MQPLLQAKWFSFYRHKQLCLLQHLKTINMKNLSNNLRLNKMSIQILDDKSLVNLRGGAAIADTCNEGSCKVETCGFRSCKDNLML